MSRADLEVARISPDLRLFGRKYRKLRADTESARQVLLETIREAAALGVSEAEIARVTGVQRETVRKALGKG